MSWIHEMNRTSNPLNKRLDRCEGLPAILVFWEKEDGKPKPEFLVAREYA